MAITPNHPMDKRQLNQEAIKVESPRFNKYKQLGAYHYNHTLGARTSRDYDLRLSARYRNAVTLLGPKQGDFVLDAGSGEGVASILCCRMGARAIALELDEEACRLGTEIREKEGFDAFHLNFRRESLYNLSFPNGTFDKILSLEVIEHMTEVDIYLRELKRVLKPGGTIVFSTPLRRDDGVLQDPYHVTEYSYRTLNQTLSSFFSNVRVVSAWSGSIAIAYDSNWPLGFLGKLKRRGVKCLGLFGWNIFSRTVPFDRRCPLLLASGCNG